MNSSNSSHALLNQTHASSSHDHHRNDKMQNMVLHLLFKQEEENDLYTEVYAKIEVIGFLEFDDQELVNLIEKRHLYLESISKLYNELALINKLKVKEYETLT
jgi:hypothetical protein